VRLDFFGRPPSFPLARAVAAFAGRRERVALSSARQFQYGTFTIPVAKRISGILTTLDIEETMIQRTKQPAAAEGAFNVGYELRDVFVDGFGGEPNSQDAFPLGITESCFDAAPPRPANEPWAFGPLGLPHTWKRFGNAPQCGAADRNDGVFRHGGYPGRCAVRSGAFRSHGTSRSGSCFCLVLSPSFRPCAIHYGSKCSRRHVGVSVDCCKRL
jgi:hypothetical protein